MLFAFFLILSTYVSTCANSVAYFSFGALGRPPTSVLVIIIGLIACAALEVIVPRLCEIFLAPPLFSADAL